MIIRKRNRRTLSSGTHITNDIISMNLLRWIGIAFIIVFPLLFLGGVHIGSLSIRIVVAFVLIAYTSLRGFTCYRLTKEIQLYFAYIGVYILTNSLNLTAFSIGFVKDLIAVHFICCITIFAFPRIFKTEASIRGAYIVLAFGFLLNALTTILQSFNIPLGWTIGMAVNPLEQSDLEEMQSVIDNHDGFQRAFIMGIMGRVTGNGYFIATMLPVMTYHVWGKFQLKKAIWTLFIFALSISCIYFMQQRMAMVVLGAYLLFIILMKRKSAFTKLYAAFATAIILAISMNHILHFDYTQMGRLSDFTDESRSSILHVLDVFSSDMRRLLLGCNLTTTEEQRHWFLTIGHNTFTDAFRMGGLPLLFTFIPLFYFLCKSLVRIFIFSYRTKDFRTMGLAVGCLCNLLYSQTHSTGIQSGSFMFWILYMLTLQSHRIRYETRVASKQSIVATH